MKQASPSSLRKTINRLRKKVYDKATSYKFVKICAILSIIIYLGLLLLGITIAYLFGGLSSDPGEFYIWTNYISDLAGINFTPAPYLYDIAAIVSGVLTIPCWFYLEKLFIPLPEKPEDYNKITRLRYRLGSYALLSSVIGSIGYIGIGIFSIDRDYMNIMHLFSGALAFGGFILGAILFGLIILLYETKIPKIIGIYGIFGPISFAGLAGVILLVKPEWICLFEWLLLFSILVWLMILALIIRNKENLHI